MFKYLVFNKTMLWIEKHLKNKFINYRKLNLISSIKYV